MACNSIQLQNGLSLPEFQRLYGTEEQCVALGLLRSSGRLGDAALARWVTLLGCHGSELVYGWRFKRYQCRNRGHQASLTAMSLFRTSRAGERHRLAGAGAAFLSCSP